MLKSTKLAIRASEIRSEVNKLDPGEASLEKRRTLLAELETVETEYREALKKEADEAAANEQRADPGLSAEEREFRQLDQRAELRNALRAVMNDGVLSGAEAELQSAAGLSGNALPWELIAPRLIEPRAATEDRVDAVSAAPGDSHLMQHPILARVFSRTATMALGVPMPMVAIGEQNFPVISAGASAMILAEDGDHGDATAATITAHKIGPRRIQSEYLFRREDAAVLMGLEEALRRDLSDQLGDKLDSEVLIGGDAPQFGGFLSMPAQGGLADVAEPAAVPTFATAAQQLALGVDGKYAGSEAETCIVIGEETYRVLAGTFQANDAMASTGYYRMLTKRTMASANIPDQDADDVQDGVLARVGAAGMNSVAPVWGSGVTFIRDEVSSALRKAGHISVTAVMLCGFDILRAGGYRRLRYKLA